MSRTALRTAAVLGATAALTFAGAGGAAATTVHSSKVDGNTVSVTFNWTSDGIIDRADTCSAALVEPAAALDLATAFASGDIGNIFAGLLDEPGVHVLTEEGLIVDRPAVLLGDLKPSATVETEVATGIYTLVSICSDDAKNPQINPFVLVGDPLEAILGSVDGLSSGEGGGLDTLSSVIGGGEEDGGIGALLSSTLGGDNEGSFLDGISSNGDNGPVTED